MSNLKKPLPFLHIVSLFFIYLTMDFIAKYYYLLHVNKPPLNYFTEKEA